MPKQHFLMLAHTYRPGRDEITGRFVSEKLDGERFIWDGGISRGAYADQIPWANTTKDTNRRIATGLWSRYAKPIAAPDWFLDQFPWFPVDGELYTGNFQELSSIVRRWKNPVSWEKVIAWIFDAPPPKAFFKDRDINIPGMNLSIRCAYQDMGGLKPETPFISRWKWLQNNLYDNTNIKLLSQRKLSLSTQVAEKQLNQILSNILYNGGEGIMIRSPQGLWEPQRSWGLLKYKPFDIEEGKVIGYIAGKGKHLGRMGSLIIESRNGQRFQLSGFTDEERERVPFPIGSVVKYKYRGLTKEGKPKEARYLR